MMIAGAALALTVATSVAAAAGSASPGSRNSTSPQVALPFWDRYLARQALFQQLAHRRARAGEQPPHQPLLVPNQRTAIDDRPIGGVVRRMRGR